MLSRAIACLGGISRKFHKRLYILCDLGHISFYELCGASSGMVVTRQHPGWRSIAIFGGGAPNKDGLIALVVNYGTMRHATRAVHVRIDARSAGMASRP